MSGLKKLLANYKIHRAYNRVREMNFSLSGLVGFDLFGKTAGVLGTGRSVASLPKFCADSECASLLLIFIQTRNGAAQHGIEYMEARTLARESDLITLHTPLTPETDHIVNKDTLA